MLFRSSIGQITYGYSFMPDTEDEPGYDWIAVLMTDANNTNLDIHVARYPIGAPVDTIAQGVYTPSLELGIDYGGLNNITIRPAVLRLIDIAAPVSTIKSDLLAAAQVGRVIEMVAFDPAFAGSPTALIPDCLSLPLVITGYEAGVRLTASGISTLGAPAVVTELASTETVFGFDFWVVDETTGQGYKAFYISTEDLKELPDFPASNLLIRSTENGYATFWKLTSGEYQLNIGPNSVGHVTVRIFDTWPPTMITNADFNIIP